jgi:hypothetical protein
VAALRAGGAGVSCGGARGRGRVAREGGAPGQVAVAPVRCVAAARSVPPGSTAARPARQGAGPHEGVSVVILWRLME